LIFAFRRFGEKQKLEKLLIIITGLSGSGKSTALTAFEDAGFYCVDNMPVVLLPNFLQLPFTHAAEIPGFVFVMDLREKTFLSNYKGIFASVREAGFGLHILYMEAGEEILLRRYSQTRRHHPVGEGKSLWDGIRAEKIMLRDLKKIADHVIDTSHYNVHQLKAVILSIAQKTIQLTPMRIRITSFGFKYGVPQDADLIMDVRFLTNPYFVDELKDLDGEDAAVKNFVLQNQEAHLFLEKYLDLLDYLVPLYEREGKAYLTLAVGCTGGRHRSVTIARALYEHIQNTGKLAELTHRDIREH
jgi:UPF0042 nucleotide-binding protein